MAPSAEDPRWVPIRQALERLKRKGARWYWIREDGAALLELRCVKDAAEAIRAEREVPEETDSDGRAAAVIQVLRECIAPRTTTQARLVWILLDLGGAAREATLTERRTAAGEQFRGKDAKGVGPSAVRQTYEGPAFDWLTNVLLAYEDAHIARHDG
jgi:hypothetical protein